MSNRKVYLRMWPGWENIWPEAENIASLDEKERAEIREKSGLRHAAFHAGASVYGALGLREWGNAQTYQPEEVGLIATGGPLNLEVAWKFLERGLSSGYNAVNPLSFPHTIVSGVPTSVAASVQAKAFAFAVGHDVHAFFSALWRGRALLESGVCRAVLVVAAVDANPILMNIARSAGLDRPVGDTVICGVLESSPTQPNESWQVSQIFPPERIDRDVFLRESKTDACLLYSFDGWTLSSSPVPTLLSEMTALTATGAVACLETMQRFPMNANEFLSKTEFLLVFESRGVTSAISLEKTTSA